MGVDESYDDQDYQEAEAPEEDWSQAEYTGDDDDGLDRIYDRMDEMSSQQQALLDAFQNQRNGDEDEDDDDEDLEEIPIEDEEGNLTEEGARQVIADLVAQHVEAQLAPRDYEEGILARDEDFEALREEEPGLQNDEVAAVVINRAVEWASRNDPGIIDRPDFVGLIEDTYKAMMYDEQRAAQAPRGVVLESGTGAAPQVDSDEDWGDRIVAAAERLRPKI